MTTRTIPRPLVIVPFREIWLWPSRLSLQAPIVAVLWQLLLADSLRVKLDPAAAWALGLAVWLIYIADHLLDTARPQTGVEPPRKSFCRKHWNKFLALAAAITCCLAIFVGRLLSTTTIEIGWRVFWAVACYFAIIHLTPNRWRRAWPREVVVATIFAFGTFCAVWSTVQLVVPVLIFMALCCMNCCVIEAWEKDEALNPIARWIAAQTTLIGLAITAGAGLLALTSRQLLPFALAAGGSGLAFVVLNQFRDKIALRFVSPVVDLVLCSPLFFWIGRH